MFIYIYSEICDKKQVMNLFLKIDSSSLLITDITLVQALMYYKVSLYPILITIFSIS
jgi:hypothetical protein